MCCIVPQNAHIFVLSMREVRKSVRKKSEGQPDRRQKATHTTHSNLSDLLTSLAYGL